MTTETTVLICSPSLLDREADVLGCYWALKRSGLPDEWTVDERQQLANELQALRDAYADKTVALEDSDDLEAFMRQNELYIALTEALKKVRPEVVSA